MELPINSYKVLYCPISLFIVAMSSISQEKPLGNTTVRVESMFRAPPLFGRVFIQKRVGSGAAGGRRGTRQPAL